MMRNGHTAKSAADASMEMFLSMLKHKAAWHGRRMIKANQWFASTKTCNDCGEKNSDVVLGVDSWVCPSCGSILERDNNAARNLYGHGQEVRKLGG